MPGHGPLAQRDRRRTTRRARCLRIVMAHYGFAAARPGANDNALGSRRGGGARRRGSTLIEPGLRRLAGGHRRGGARLHRLARPPRGARARTPRARAHGAQAALQWALSLDEVGRDRPFWLRSPVSGPRPRRRGRAARRRRARGTSRSAGCATRSTGNSDHREFQLLGLPAAKLGVGAGGEPCRHMACDRPSRLDPKSLVLARRMTAGALRAR